MSTPNFCSYEAKKCYACGITDETYQDTLIYDDTKDNIYYELKNVAKEKGYTFIKRNENKMYSHLFNRSYGGSYICSLEHNKCFGDIDINIVIHAILVGGYYQGFTLDYISEIQFNGDEQNNFDDFLCNFDYRDLQVYTDTMPLGMLKIQSKNIEKFIRSAYDELTGQIENIYGQYCDEKLRCIGVASNGEAFYEKIV